MRTLLIRNGRLLDAAQNLDAVRDLWVCDGRFAPADFRQEQPDETLDGSGLIVLPGLVDVHVHFREPGNEAAETVASGCASALAAGVTSLIVMPNTNPPLDTPERLRQLLDRAAAQYGPRVYAMGCLSIGRAGRKLSDLKALSDAGAIAFTDDGTGLQDAALLQEAMEQCAALNKPFVEHCEDIRLADGGMMHAGRAAESLRLPGIPTEAETAMVERDLLQAELSNCRVHLQHLSSRRSAELIMMAKSRGARVTSEVTPHHLLLSEWDAARGGTNFKMNPPLRSEQDMLALRLAMREGVIDCIATDHAPHTTEAKSRGMIEAPFGVIGMETALAAVWTGLVADGFMPALRVAWRMCASPAAAFDLPAGTLLPGRPADVALFDPAAEWVVDPMRFRSRSRNCPFAGQRMKGRVVATLVDGVVKYRQTQGQA